MSHPIKRLEEQITRWAQAQDDIRALIVIGSQARHHQRAGELSDLDLLIFTEDIASYTGDGGWLRGFGEVWVALLQATGAGDPEWLAIYEGGHKVDFVFYDLDVLQAEETESEHLTWRDVCRRGAYVPVDKGGQVRPLLPASFGPPPVTAPTSDQYARTTQAFWYEVMVIAKFIKRRELWTVQIRDMQAKRHLLQMMEWDARAHGRDTWHDGRFMAGWVDTQVYSRLRPSFPRFDAADCWRALLTTMDLFRDFARQLADHYAFTYPRDLDDNTTRYVESLRIRP